MLLGLVAFLVAVLGYVAAGYGTSLLMRYRGQANSDDVMEAVATILLWPVCLWASQFKLPWGTHDPVKALRKLPRCTSRIVYTARDDFGRELPGIFTFRAADVENVVAGLNTSGAELAALRAWLRGYSEADEKATLIPAAFEREFARSVLPLLGSGLYLAYCRRCQAVVTSLLSHQKNSKTQAGWNATSYLCNDNHLLFSVRTLHISSGAPATSSDHPSAPY